MNGHYLTNEATLTQTHDIGATADRYSRCDCNHYTQSDHRAKISKCSNLRLLRNEIPRILICAAPRFQRTDQDASCEHFVRFFKGMLPTYIDPPRASGFATPEPTLRYATVLRSARTEQGERDRSYTLRSI